jgi:general secretion pathway protein L
MVLWIFSQGRAACTHLLAAWWGELDAMRQEMRRIVPFRHRPYLDLAIRNGIPAPTAAEGNPPEDFIRARRNTPVRLCLEPGLFLKRRLYLPRTAVWDARRILLLELERATPFSPADVFQGWTCEHLDETKVVVDHVIVRRDLLQPWLDYLSALHIPFVSEVGLGIDQPPGVELLGEVIRQNPHMRHLRRFRRLAFATMLSAALACVVAAHWRQSAALDQLASDLAAIQPKALEARKRRAELETISNRSAALRQYRLSFRSTLALWRELTGLVPDSAWLTELRIERDEIAISGFAQSSAVILERIEGSAGFEKAAFVSPVMKSPGESLERFAIRASLSNSSSPHGLSIEMKAP